MQFKKLIIVSFILLSLKAAEVDEGSFLKETREYLKSIGLSPEELKPIKHKKIEPGIMLRQKKSQSPIQKVLPYGWVQLKDRSVIHIDEVANSAGRSLVTQAIADSNGELQGIKGLVDLGANINRAMPNGITPLMIAVLRNYPKIVEYLIENYARVNAQTLENKTTALMYAAMFGFDSVVDVLLKSQNIEINLQDAYGRTALMWAALNGYDEIVMKLLKSGANKNIKDTKGKTAEDLAKQQGYSNVADEINTFTSSTRFIPLKEEDQIAQDIARLEKYAKSIEKQKEHEQELEQIEKEIEKRQARLERLKKETEQSIRK